MTPALSLRDAGPAEAAAVLRRLELTVRRRLDGLLQGNHLGLVPGPGSEAGSPASTTPATTSAGWTGR